MKIKGIQKLSLIDYPDHLCSIIFLSGCNFRCPFCYNPDLVFDSAAVPEIPKAEVLHFLESRKKYIDGVTVTGGEPLLSEGLPEFLAEVRQIGLLVKLDTNGSNPSLLGKILADKLVDYVAMDIKSSLDKYDVAVGTVVDKEKVKESAGLLMKSGVEYEFRTTVVPSLVERSDIEKIGKWLNGAKRYFLQQFRPKKTLDPTFQKLEPYPLSELQGMAEIARPFFGRVAIRNV